MRSATRDQCGVAKAITTDAVALKAPAIAYESLTATTMKITEAAKDFIVDKGYDVQYGARPLKRAIQKYLEDPMAEEIIQSNLSEGDQIEIDYDTEKKEITVKTIKPKGKKKKEDS